MLFVQVLGSLARASLKTQISFNSPIPSNLCYTMEVCKSVSGMKRDLVLVLKYWGGGNMFFCLLGDLFLCVCFIYLFIFNLHKGLKWCQ